MSKDRNDRADGRTGLSRRDVLKAGAAAGVTAVAAPWSGVAAAQGADPAARRRNVQDPAAQKRDVPRVAIAQESQGFTVLSTDSSRNGIFYPYPTYSFASVLGNTTRWDNGDTLVVNPGTYQTTLGHAALSGQWGWIRGSDPANRPVLLKPNGPIGGILSMEWVPYQGGAGFDPGVLVPTAASNYTALGQQRYDVIFSDLIFKGGKNNADPGTTNALYVGLGGQARGLVYRCRFESTNTGIVQTTTGSSVPARALGQFHMVSCEFFDNGSSPSGATTHAAYIGVPGDDTVGGNGSYYGTGEVLAFANRWWGIIETVDGTINGTPLDPNAPGDYTTPQGRCSIGYFLKSLGQKNVIIANAFLGGYTHLSAAMQNASRNRMIVLGNIIEEAKFSDNRFRCIAWFSEGTPPVRNDTIDIHQNTIINRSSSNEKILDHDGSPTKNIDENLFVSNPNRFADSGAYPTNSVIAAAGLVDANNLTGGGAAPVTPIAGASNYAKWEYQEPMSYRTRTDANRGAVAPSVAPAWYKAISPGNWGKLGGGIGSPLNKTITDRNPPGPNGVFWPWHPGADPFNIAWTKIQGLYPLPGDEGPSSTMTSFSSGEITYGGCNVNGTTYPGVFYAWNGGGHRVSADNSVYGIGPIDSDNCKYHRLCDPSVPPLHNSSDGKTRDYTTNTWAPGTGIYAPDGGPPAVHSYGHVVIIPPNRLLCTTGSVGFEGSRPGIQFELDLTVNNRGVGGRAWKTTARGANTWQNATARDTDCQEASSVYHAQSNYVWITHQNIAQYGYVFRRRPVYGAGVQVVNVVNPGATLVNGNAPMLAPIDDQPFILIHRRQEIVPSFLDVTNPDAPVAYPIALSGMASPTHFWSQTGYAFYGCWVWNHIDKWFNGYFAAAHPGGGWDFRDRIYTLKMPGVTPGVSGNPRTTPWRLSYVIAGGLIPTDHDYNLAGSSCYKQLRFVGTANMKGLAMFHSPFVEPLFHRLP